MTTLRTIKKLLLGETWVVPLGLATTLVLGAVVRLVDTDLTGPILLGGVLAVLSASVSRTARDR